MTCLFHRVYLKSIREMKFKWFVVFSCIPSLMDLLVWNSADNRNLCARFSTLYIKMPNFLSIVRIGIELKVLKPNFLSREVKNKFSHIQ